MSFNSKKCVVTSSGCYLTEIPRIYSTGNIPVGFSTSQYGDIDIVSLLDHNFTADTTVYARVINRKNISADYNVLKVYQLGSNKEYYEVDFENSLQEEFVNHYSGYIAGVFEKVPQLFILHGKMRFFTKETYAANFGNSRMNTFTVPGLYSSIEASPQEEDDIERIKNESMYNADLPATSAPLCEILR